MIVEFDAEPDFEFGCELINLIERCTHQPGHSMLARQKAVAGWSKQA
jgi:hypothetical protein